MKWTVLLFSVSNVCFGSPVGLPDVDNEVVEYEDFLKDIVMAAELRRVRRDPVEDVVGKTVFDLLSGRLSDENLERVRRDESNQMLIMGSPYERGSPDCDSGNMHARDAEEPLEYYQDYSPPLEYYQGGPSYQGVPISMPYPQVPTTLPYQQPLPVQEQYEPYVTRTGLVPKVYKSKTVGATAGIGIPLADGGGAVTHTGNLGGLGLPGLAGLGGGGLAGGGLGGLGATGLSGITAGVGLSAVGHGHGHKGVGSIALPVGHEPAYITSIPFISGYELKPIYAMKKVVVKEIGKDHIGHKGLGLPGLTGLSGLQGLGARSADGGVSHDLYLDDPTGHNLGYQVVALSGLPSLPGTLARSAEESPPPHHFYVENPGDHQPLDLNIFFVDPAQAKEASEPELMSPEAYSDAIRTLQQRMEHLQSMKLAQELKTQPEEFNCV